MDREERIAKRIYYTIGLVTTLIMLGAFPFIQ